MNPSKIPVTAVVASRNEGHSLEDCLKSITFCDEIFVYDLESSDNTIAIAELSATKVIKHKLVPVVEELRIEASGTCKNPWMLFLDPDERIEPALAQIFIDVMRSAPNDVGLVYAPCIFYFKHKKLKGTVWGPEKYRPTLYHRERIILTPDVHFGTKLREGFRDLRVGNFVDAGITHYWSESYIDLLRKHYRYAKREGSSRYNNGDRYPGLYQHVRSSIAAIYACYRHFKGYQDGITGLFLSIVWGWYTFAGLSSLRKHQREVENK